MALIKLNNQSLTAVTSAGLPADISLFKRAYHGEMTASMQWTGSFTTMMSIPNVVVNAGEKVYLSYSISARSTSNGSKHTTYRITYSGDSSGSSGDGGWGFGINDTTGTSWQLDTNMLCLSEFPTLPFTGTGTMTVNLQGKSNTSAGYWAGESTAVHEGYTNAVFSIYVGN